MKQMYTVLTGIPHPFGQYRSQSQVYSPRKDTPLCQAPYFFGNENTIVQCTKHGIMCTCNKV